MPQQLTGSVSIPRWAQAAGHILLYRTKYLSAPELLHAVATAAIRATSTHNAPATTAIIAASARVTITSSTITTATYAIIITATGPSTRATADQPATATLRMHLHQRM